MVKSLFDVSVRIRARIPIAVEAYDAEHAEVIAEELIQLWMRERMEAGHVAIDYISNPKLKRLP